MISTLANESYLAYPCTCGEYIIGNVTSIHEILLQNPLATMLFDLIFEKLIEVEKYGLIAHRGLVFFLLKEYWCDIWSGLLHGQSLPLGISLTMQKDLVGVCAERIECKSMMGQMVVWKEATIFLGCPEDVKFAVILVDQFGGHLGACARNVGCRDQASLLDWAELPGGR